MVKYSRRCALLFLLPGIFATCIFCDAAPISDPITLRVKPEKGLTLTAKNEATWDFGTRKSAPGDTLAHTFTLENKGRTPVTLDSLLTSCHCTTATLTGPGTAKSGDPPFALAPGKSVGLNVAIDLDEAHAVDLRKMVWVYVKGRDEAAFTLTIAGTIRGGQP